MALKDIVLLIDREIAKLVQARTLLATPSTDVASRKPGRPPKAESHSPAEKPQKKKRNLSPEGRARIAEAVKRCITM
jgi:hypothetical protein